MKIIHCSDLHLDSKNDTNFTPKLAQQRNHEICLSFERMLEFAQKNAVTAILLCGDMFDSSRIRQTTVDFILDLIRRFPQILFFYLRGNHDESLPLNMQALPKNLKLFSNKWQYYILNDLVIGGIETDPSNAETLYDTLKLDANKTNIIMMHGQIGTESAVDQVNLSLLKEKNIDYLALGHLHSYQTCKLDYRGSYCYSGCLEGRGFDETGRKGFVLLEINPHSIQARFIDFASRNFHKFDFDISNYNKITEILNELRKACNDISENDFVQISLLGSNKSGSTLDVAFLENALASQFFYVRILDKTRFTDMDSSEYSRNSLRNEFIKSVNTDSTLTEEEKNSILQIGLSAIHNEEFQR